MYEENVQINKACEVCGKILEGKPAIIKKRRFCSNTCSQKYSSNETIKQKEIIKPKIEEYRKTHSLKETKEFFNVSQSYISQLGITGPEKKKGIILPSELTLEQHQTLLGNLLGTGKLIRTKDNGNSKFVIFQNAKFNEYIKTLEEIYQPFSAKCKEIKRLRISKTNDVPQDNNFYKLSTVSHPIFTQYRQQWYIDIDDRESRKIIPDNLTLSWKTVAIWMQDFGSNNLKSRTAILRASKFTCEETEFLIYLLKNNLNIYSKMYCSNGHPIIYISKDNWFEFIERIKPFITSNCFQHKCTNRDKSDRKEQIELTRIRGIELGKNNLSKALLEHGWECISEYSSNGPMQFKCNHGVIFTRTRATVMNPSAKCDCDNYKARMEVGKQILLTKIQPKGWELISEYKERPNKVTLKCEHGKEFQRLPNNIDSKSICDCKPYDFCLKMTWGNRWKVIIRLDDGKLKSLGVYNTQEQAILVRDEYFNTKNLCNI